MIIPSNLFKYEKMKQPDKNIVKVANELIRAVQRLSLNEKRLLMLGLTKVDSSGSINQLVIIKADEFASIYGISRKTAYETIKATKERLWEREALIEDAGIRWVITYKTPQDVGYIGLRFHPDLSDYILDLKGHFTQYLLSKAADFKHLYSWRLFELLMQFRTTGLLKMPVDDFKRIMEVPEAYERDFGLIRSKVINLALAEIKDKAGLPVKFAVEKEGRKVVLLKFTFSTEQQERLPLVTKTASSAPESVASQNIDTYHGLSRKEVLSRYTGELSLAKLSNQAIDALVSTNEFEAFKHYGLI